MPPIKPNGEFFKAGLVLSGTVLSQRYFEDEKEAGWFYSIRVAEVFKGPRTKFITIYTGDTDNRYPLDIGKAYLLFVYLNGGRYSIGYRGRFNIDDCGNSAPLSQAAKIIEEIKSIGHATDGEIEGWVAPITSGINLAGIHVVVRSRSQEFRSVTDGDGHFEFRARPGRYRMDFTNGEYFTNSGDDFWYDPEHFTLHAGETASLQVVSVRDAEKSRRESQHLNSDLSGQSRIAVRRAFGTAEAVPFRAHCVTQFAAPPLPGPDAQASDHSYRSATMGSTRAARSAGK